ncbi:MAG: methionyl-tRNA formyltransferase [Pseudomonadota bacterium]
MKIIFMGSSDFAVPALESLSLQHDILAVYTKMPKPAGRGMKLKKTPVHIRAEKLGLHILTPKNFKSPEDIEAYRAFQADVTVVASYGLILPKIILEAPHYGALNIHGSLLPAWRGAAPIHRAIMAGDKNIGVTIIQMSEGLDEGDMLAKWHMPLSEGLTTGEAHDILAQEGANLIAKVINDIEYYQKQAEIQDNRVASYAHKITKAECEIDWTRPTEDILRFIRALNPFPSAFCYIDGKRCKIHAAEAISIDQLEQEFCFKTADGAVKATLIQFEGKGKRDIK